jgi:hypothetical protein
MRHTWTFRDYNVKCRHCDWEYWGRNGLGLAAKHHDKYNHSVDVEVMGGVSYLTDEDHMEMINKRKGLVK